MRPIIEELDRSNKIPVAPTWLVTLTVTLMALVASILLFNYGA